MKIFKYKPEILLCGVLILGAILRLIGLNQSLWLDEAIGAVAVRNKSLTDVLVQFPKGDNHPPLYYAFLDIWTSIFGYSEIAIRSLSVIAGVSTIWITYKIANLWFKRNTIALFAALLLATSPLHVYYSQEARMYVFAGLFAAMSMYFFIKTLNEDNLLLWIGFSTSTLFVIFTDYMPVFLFPFFLLYALFYIRKTSWWKKFFLSFIPLVIFSILWLPILILQSKGGSWLLENLPAWRDLAGGATLKQAALVWIKFVLGRISLPNKIIYYSLIIITSIPYFIALLHTKLEKSSRLLWLWLLLPLFTGFVVSFVFPAFIYFRFLFVIPAFYLLVSYGVNSIKKGSSKTILAFLLLTVNLLGLVIYYNDPHQQREDWRSAVSYIESHATTNDIVLFENVEPFAPYQFYATKNINADGALGSILSHQPETGKRVVRLTRSYSGIYLFEYLHNLQDPEGNVVQTLASEGYTKTAIYDVNGVGQIMYWSK